MASVAISDLHLFLVQTLVKAALVEADKQIVSGLESTEYNDVFQDI